MPFDAKAMLNIAEQQDAENTEKEFAEVQDKIQRVSFRGHLETDLVINCRGTIKKLKELGFKVIRRPSTTYFRVSWDGNKDVEF